MAERREGDSARLQAAAGMLPRGSHEQLLRSIVEVARAIFGAKASSVMLHEPEAGELVFEAVVGEGEDTLIGKRIPADAGIAGWVLTSGQPLVVEDVQSDPRFARDVAARSGYVPKGLMAVPLISGEEAIGVLSVLDRPQESRFSVAEMELLSLFATQAAITLDLLRRSRAARAALEPADGGDEGPLERLVGALEELDEDRRQATMGLLDALVKLLENDEAPGIRFDPGG